MSPDLDRLVTAAENGYQEACLPNERLSQRTIQAIVRAVLMELREVGEGPLAAGAVDLLREVADPWDCMPAEMDAAFGIGPELANSYVSAEELIRPKVRRSFTAMIDHILSDPAEA